jgi:hypothetical protein
MSTNNVTPIKRGAGEASAQDLGAAETAFSRARAIVDLLQGAAAHEAIEPPANDESLAIALGLVRDLLDEVESAIWPAQEEQP